ncbi:hypothetical protein [Photobacterium leiognathi]|uniref:hypothetical protein n=1 Tax=Photobacterium leiognathi TaxID=553611 RepID=UPI0027359463|nr:hypothetical protein [Photobacterium leiognathi]
MGSELSSISLSEKKREINNLDKDRFHITQIPINLRKLFFKTENIHKYSIDRLGKEYYLHLSESERNKIKFIYNKFINANANLSSNINRGYLLKVKEKEINDNMLIDDVFSPYVLIDPKQKEIKKSSKSCVKDLLLSKADLIKKSEFDRLKNSRVNKSKVSDDNKERCIKENGNNSVSNFKVSSYMLEINEQKITEITLIKDVFPYELIEPKKKLLEKLLILTLEIYWD